MLKTINKLKTKALPDLEKRLEKREDVERTEDGWRLTGPYYDKQVRIALLNSDIIDPGNIHDYIALDGYFALADLLENKQPEDVIEEISNSLLRGRGGAGFPTGRKWATACKYNDKHKYIICNADEGDPGAFMDRYILESDPHSVLEGMAIAGYGIGADYGYIYVRAEYPKAIKSLSQAIKQAEELNLLGKNILGSDFSFSIELRLGAGAYVCGEGTALMQSIEGRRGMPRIKEFRTAQKGLFDMPTIINNVETLANVHTIMLKGADWFRSIGTEKSPGTKVFALVGKVKNAGLVEVPMGTPLREVVYDIGGGCKQDKKLKAVQTGGPSGGCIPTDLIDTPLDYESLKAIGSIMGSGGMVVMDESDCMVDLARFFMEFTVDESCGKCTPCRIGNKRVLEMLDRIIAGLGEEKDLDYLQNLCEVIRDTSLCGLGQSAPYPVLSTMKYFRDEYVAHITDKECPAHACKSLAEYYITESCVGCGFCVSICPTSCIEGEHKKMHYINNEECIKCGQCRKTCPVHAVITR